MVYCTYLIIYSTNLMTILMSSVNDDPLYCKSTLLCQVIDVKQYYLYINRIVISLIIN